MPSISLDDIGFRRLVRHLHGLGPRPVAEFLLALANAKRPSTSEDIMYLLVQYAGIDAATVEALGGKDFPPLPMYPIT